MLLCLRRVRCPAVRVLLCLCNHSCTQRFLSTHSIHVMLRVRPMHTATTTTRGLHQGTSGNVSARVPGGLVITPSGMPYEDLKPEHMVLVDTAGGYYGPLLPSSEWRMHYDVYKHKPDAMAVLHAHPTYCTALAAQEKGIPAFHYMVAAAGAKEIKCAQVRQAIHAWVWLHTAAIESHHPSIVTACFRTRSLGSYSWCCGALVGVGTVCNVWDAGIVGQYHDCTLGWSARVSDGQPRYDLLRQQLSQGTRRCVALNVFVCICFTQQQYQCGICLRCIHLVC